MKKNDIRHHTMMNRSAVGRGVKGFTLIELLVVIAIIALLLSVIIPSLRLAKEQARKVICKTNLSSMGKSLESYGLTYNYKRLVIRKDPLEKDPYWMGKLTPFLGKDDYMTDYAEGKVIDVFMCPSAPAAKFVRDDFNMAGGSGYWGTDDIPWEWLRTTGVSTLGSITINGWIAYDYVYDKKAGYEEFMYRDWLSIPSSVPMFADGIWTVGWPKGADVPPIDLQGCVNINPGESRQSYLGTDTNNMRRFCIDQHNKEINLIYRDLSIQSVDLEELWDKPWHKDYQRPATAVVLPAQ
jgi:prepilin-type N-terminal cleavage/methylation domain-containing protein